MSAPAPTPAPSTSIALITASLRQSNNNAGLAAWLIARFASLPQPTPTTYTLQLASDLCALPLPYGPVEDSLIAQAVPLGSSHKYSDPAVRAWSQTITAAPAVVIVTPQYNWSFPGPLKNLLDHLYNEWAGKPVVLVTYGGHGGGRCAEALSVVLEGGLHMQMVGKVAIPLPSEFIRTGERVGTEEYPEFLRGHEEAVDGALVALLERIKQTEQASS